MVYFQRDREDYMQVVICSRLTLVTMEPVRVVILYSSL